MCITTDGGKYSCHPDGKRGMTIREFAALQGFPHHHEFFGREIRKQSLVFPSEEALGAN